MTFLFLHLVDATALATEAVRLALHDGSGPQRPRASNFEDPRFHAPLSQ
jgi:hypothetical protein